MAKKKKSQPDAVVQDAVVPDALVPDAVAPDAVVPDAKPVAEAKPAPTPAPEPTTASLYRPLLPATARPTAGAVPGQDAPVALAADVSLEGSANAPFIYFENAGVSGHMNGLVRVTLEANRLLPGENNKVFIDRVIVGHLRMNIPAAQSLRNALDRALLIASKPASREVN